MWKLFKRTFFLFFAAVIIVMIEYIILPSPGKYLRDNPDTTSFMRMRIEEAEVQEEPYKFVQTYVPLKDISPYLVDAIRISEDAGFYQHSGFDLYEMREAFLQNLKKGKLGRGASTISQQLCKNLFLTPEKSLYRKFKEAVLTMKLESQLPKARIMELYLNYIELGEGIFGVEAACKSYFGISAGEVSPFEAARLAAIIPSPRKWDPVSPNKILARRTKTLLTRMFKYKKLSLLEYNDALEEYSLFFNNN